MKISKENLNLLIFNVVFLLIYSILNYYLLSQMFDLYNHEMNYWFYIFLIILTFSFTISMTLERNMPNNFTRALYVISAIWMGALFYILCCLLIYNLLDLFLTIPERITAYSIIYFCLFLTAISVICDTFVRTRFVNIPIKNLNKNIRIVHLTDLHLGTIMKGRFLKKIVKKTNALNPDIVVITGDLFDGSAPLTQDIIKPLNNIKAKTFFVIGNHEIYDGVDKVTKLLKKTKLHILRNKSITYRGIQFIGIDYYEDQKEFENILLPFKMNKNKPSILLHHDPSNIDLLDKKGINLHLAGHTHAGQIFPFNLLVRLKYKYINGLYKKNNSYLYVSSGTGTWGPPMRFGSFNEITLITLKKE